ncbi:DUF6894 family protein [Sphingomonas natans]|uniref:DUF6894 family protein n=1 Tax=Sphingomonas natans TaxID=3063330 RepID=UPI003D6774D2
MARYFFHVQTDVRSTDLEGWEFDTPIEARSQAIATCGQMMRDAAEAFWGSRPWSVSVTNAVGLILWELSMDGYAAPAALDIA